MLIVLLERYGSGCDVRDQINLRGGRVSRRERGLAVTSLREEYESWMEYSTVQCMNICIRLPYDGLIAPSDVGKG